HSIRTILLKIDQKYGQITLYIALIQFHHLVGAAVLFLILFFLPETFRLLPQQNLPISDLECRKMSAASGSSTRLHCSCLASLPISTTSIGLCYLGSGIGNIVGFITGGRLSDCNLTRLWARHPQGKSIPEMRLATLWIGGAFLIPLGNLIYGWLLDVLIAGLNWVGVGFVYFVIRHGEEWREKAGLVPATTKKR
ncbi:hypothetical protein BC937DRAFT_86343, partial [Endogone sp. FLAS-F59071]